MKSTLMFLLSLNAFAVNIESGSATLSLLKAKNDKGEARALYIFDKDINGISSCYDACAVTWPPILVDEKHNLQVGQSVQKRKDGRLQLAYKGKPLYFYAGDATSDDVEGDGLGGVWFVARP